MTREEMITKRHSLIKRTEAELSMLRNLPPSVDLHRLDAYLQTPIMEIDVETRAEAVQVAKLPILAPIKLVYLKQKGVTPRMQAYDLMSDATKDRYDVHYVTEILPWWWTLHAEGASLNWFLRYNDVIMRVMVSIRKDPATFEYNEQQQVININNPPLGDMQYVKAKHEYLICCYHERNGFGLHEFLSVDRAEDEPRFYGLPEYGV